MKKLNKEGFSLIELLIAISITAFMTLAIVGLLGYGSRSMSLTQAKVALQNQAKDAVNHISAYVQEASDVEWYDETGTPPKTVKSPKTTNKNALVITKTTVNNSVSSTMDPTTGKAEGKPTETSTWYYYWLEGDSVYFISYDNYAAEKGIPTGPAVTPDFPATLMSDDAKENEKLIKKRVLVENVKDFQCEVIEDADTKRKVVRVTLEMKDDVSSYVCKKDIFMRNQ